MNLNFNYTFNFLNVYKVFSKKKDANIVTVILNLDWILIII